MRGNVREFVRVVAETVEVPEPIIELGSLQVVGQLYDANLRPFFPGKHYIGCDMREGMGVERIEDIHALSFAEGSVGTVLILETLEHVENPFLAMAEIFRVLRPGGLVVASCCMDFPVHEHPADYWRLTPQGFDLLLRRFSPRRVYVQGHPHFPHTLAGVGMKGGREQMLHRLDPVVKRVPGTLTQEVPPRIGPDYFRLLGEDLTEDERWKYPAVMLHPALDKLLEKDEEIARLRAEIRRLTMDERRMARPRVTLAAKLWAEFRRLTAGAGTNR
jgi:SAM-dependent methyltransferase